LTALLDRGGNVKKDKHKLVFFIDFSPLHVSMDRNAGCEDLGDFV
jgi:hypothetical protein